MAKNFYEIKVKKQIFSAIFYQYLPELKALRKYIKQKEFEKKEQESIDLWERLKTQKLKKQNQEKIVTSITKRLFSNIMQELREDELLFKPAK